MDDIRLVIWDLDETFWSGTLAEGAIEYSDANAAIVRELAYRGIMNSIVSRNDAERATSALKAQGIFNFFIMPTINFDPKGQQIKAIIAALNFREQAVLFIDDNPLNLAEARHYNPRINVATPDDIAGLLTDPRLAGAPDPELVRLHHYRTLEERALGKSQFSDNHDFLRQSGIVVTVEFDIEQHIDRAIDIINRTNQLNFTKLRLPEDRDTARDALRSQLNDRNVQAGLIHVRDRFGDHGFVGFYSNLVHANALQYFAFSCRIFGMGVERWLYERLGRPNLAIMGEVASDLFAGPPVDWIGLADDDDASRGSRRRGHILLRGGCEVQSIDHFARLDFETSVTEAPFHRDGRLIVPNHSCFLVGALAGLTPSQRDSARALGLTHADFRSALNGSEPLDAAILSFWADAQAAVYRDRNTGLTVPFHLEGLTEEPYPDNGGDLRPRIPALIDRNAAHPDVVSALGHLADDFDYIGWTLSPLPDSAEETMFETALRVILRRISGRFPIYILLACEGREGSARAPHASLGYLRLLNDATRRAVRAFPTVQLIDPLSFIENDDDLVDATHFNRLVYFRIYQAIRCDLDRRFPLAEPDEPSGETHADARPGLLSGLVRRLQFNKRYS